MSLIQMSLTAGALIIGIVLFRVLFVRRIPKKVMMVLWGIVILRLVFPVCIPSPFPEIGVSLIRMQPAYGEAKIFVAEIMDMAQGQNEAAGDIVFVTCAPEKTDWGIVLAPLYFLGVAVMVLGSVFLYMRDSGIFRESLPMGEREKNRLILQAVPEENDQRYLGKVCFRISDRTATPVTYGIFRPSIVFPKGIFLKEDKEIGHCLLHEMIHMKNHDNIRKLVVHAVLCVHWFNPFVWVMYSLFNRDMELLCDEMAVQRCRADKQDYALTLLSLAERRAAGFRTALGFGKNAVRERVLAVMSAGKTTAGDAIATVIAVVLALTVFLGSQMVDVTAQSGESLAITTDTDVMALSTDVIEYAVTVNEAERYNVAVDTVKVSEESGVVYGDETGVDPSENMAEAVYAEETAADAETAWQIAKDISLPQALLESLQNLAGEFEGDGLKIEITSDDYQLYFKGKPVYFFADNRNQDGEGFSGRVFARPSGEGNGDTGVVTVRDETGDIVGLVNLSEEESRDYARIWTGGGM